MRETQKAVYDEKPPTGFKWKEVPQELPTIIINTSDALPTTACVKTEANNLRLLVPAA